MLASLSTTPLRHNSLLAFLLPALLSGATAAQAQQQPEPRHTNYIRLSPEDADRGLNGVQKNFWFARGNSQEYQNAGFFGQKLRPYVADDEQALASLNRYRRQKWLFLGERLLFVGAVGFYSQQVLAGDEKQYFNNNQKVAIGVAVGSLLANSLITRRTNQHFIRAVEGHNATLPTALRMGLERVKPDLIGVTAPTGQPQLLVGWTLR